MVHEHVEQGNLMKTGRGVRDTHTFHFNLVMGFFHGITAFLGSTGSDLLGRGKGDEWNDVVKLVMINQRR